jgi:molybdate transport system substrate-binding protein
MTTVLIVQPGNPKKIKTLQDLTKPGIRIGLGDPEAVAIGRAARETMVKAGGWEKAKKNVVMTAQNVSELSNAVKLKQVDAAIVWNAIAAMYNTKELATVTIPAKQAVCSPVPVGVVAYTKFPKEAKAYMEFLASPEATKIFLKHGFGAAPAAAACPPGRKQQ